MKKFSFLMFFATLSMFMQAQDIKLPDPIEGGDIPLKEALKVRETVRDFLTEDVSLEQISSLLWAANGINRPESGKRTAPSARNVQETDIYLFSQKGIFLYVPEKHILSLIREGDYRKAISDQKHFTQAPIALVLVANYDRMKGFDKESRDFYAPVDCGYISQNIYLFCTEKLGTVACGAINRDKLAELMKIKNGKVMLAHPIGYRAK